eukprot:747625-Hanusia_phi.AAC.2
MPGRAVVWWLTWACRTGRIFRDCAKPGILSYGLTLAPLLFQRATRSNVKLAVCFRAEVRAWQIAGTHSIWRSVWKTVADSLQVDEEADSANEVSRSE